MSPRQRLVAWVLVAIWIVLMAFGALSLLNPPWLQALSRPGIETEVRGYTDAGDQIMRDGNFAGALWWYEQALRIDPDNVGARVNLAIAHGRLGRPEEGLRLLREALGRNPKSPGIILYNIAELQRQMGAAAEAIATYEEALAAGGTEELICGRLGEIHSERGDLLEARDAWRAALRAREDLTIPYRRMLLAAREGAGEDPRQLATVEAALARGVTEADLARYDLDFIRQQLDRDPERARLLGRLGAVEAQLGDDAIASEHLQRALEIWPAMPEAQDYRALLARLQRS